MHGTLVLLLDHTGLRSGEAVALRGGAVDLDCRRLLVSANAVNVAGRIVWERRRAACPEACPSQPFFWTSSIGHVTVAPELSCSELVDLSAHARTHGGGWFAGARKRARLVDETIPPGLTIHDLRHMAASLAISAGANVKVVQRMLGQISAAMILDNYADLFDDDLDAVAEALNQAKRGPDVVKAGHLRPSGIWTSA